MSSAPDSGCDEVTYDVDLPRLCADSAPTGVSVTGVKLKSNLRASTGIERAAEPERRLMAAVLQGVVDDHRGSAYRHAAGFGSPTDRRRLREAAAYVASRDRRWPFSFENLCEALSLDPGRLRRALRRVSLPQTVFVDAHDVPKAEGVMALEHTPQSELGGQQRATS